MGPSQSKVFLPFSPQEHILSWSSQLRLENVTAISRDMDACDSANLGERQVILTSNLPPLASFPGCHVSSVLLSFLFTSLFFLFYFLFFLFLCLFYLLIVSLEKMFTILIDSIVPSISMLLLTQGIRNTSKINKTTPFCMHCPKNFESGGKFCGNYILTDTRQWFKCYFATI